MPQPAEHKLRERSVAHKLPAVVSFMKLRFAPVTHPCQPGGVCEAPRGIRCLPRKALPFADKSLRLGVPSLSLDSVWGCIWHMFYDVRGLQLTSSLIFILGEFA